MSKSKINNCGARRIAENISNAAFAHLITPITEQINALLRTAYHAHMRKDVAAFLVERGLASQIDAVEVVVRYGTGTTTEIIRGDTGEFTVPIGHSNQFKFLTAAETPEYAQLHEARAPLIQKRGALRNELSEQIVGKSASKVMKTWPEAAPFVANYFDLDTTAHEMTTPLDALLAKYLPMLPAPK